MRRTLLLAAAALALLAVPARAQVDLPPDMIVDPTDLLDHDVTWDIYPGCAALRLSASAANIGTGPLHLYGVFPPNPGGDQDVNQRIFRDDQSFYDRYAGTFLYHEEHNHIHFEDWAEYRLLEDVGGNPGNVLVTGEKTSFCLVDYLPYDLGLPGAPQTLVYDTCDSTVQGISVGWKDVYVKILPGQSVSLCGISDGTYWLQSEADPLDRILESDETNNVDEVQISITIPPPPICNNSIDDDFDTLTDYPADPGCFKFTSIREDPQCDDGIDNDSDTFTDYPADPDCDGSWDTTEKTPGLCGLGAEVAVVLLIFGAGFRRVGRRSQGAD